MLYANDGIMDIVTELFDDFSHDLNIATNGLFTVEQSAMEMGSTRNLRIYFVSGENHKDILKEQIPGFKRQIHSIQNRHQNNLTYLTTGKIKFYLIPLSDQLSLFIIHSNNNVREFSPIITLSKENHVFRTITLGDNSHEHILNEIKKHVVDLTTEPDKLARLENKMCEQIIAKGQSHLQTIRELQKSRKKDLKLSPIAVQSFSEPNTYGISIRILTIDEIESFWETKNIEKLNTLPQEIQSYMLSFL